MRMNLEELLEQLVVTVILFHVSSSETQCTYWDHISCQDATPEQGKQGNFFFF